MRWWRTLLLVGVGSVVVGLIGLGIGGLVLRQRVLAALARTQQLQPQIAARDIASVCRDLPPVATAWQETHALSAPAAPVLRRLGFVPALGADLQAAPDMIAAAAAGSAAGVAICDLLSPALAATSLPDQLAAAVQRAGEHPQQLVTIANQLQTAQAALERAQFAVERSARLAPYRAHLTLLRERLPAVLDALPLAQEAAPQLPWLFGVDAPRRYLLVLQNPFELRPTGGFIGMLCVIEVNAARPYVERCQPSEAFATPWPSADDLPLPYRRYLRVGSWYLRDANWSPDFPTTAQTIKDFWTLNGQPAIDGVVAVDPYILRDVLGATGALRLEDGTEITTDDLINTLLQRYYDGTTYRDKSALAGVLPTLLQRVLQADPATAVRLATALHTGAQERHLLAWLNDPASQALLAAHKWDGSMDAATTDTLRVVDADLGYGGVNAFVERLTHYEVALDANATPLTATLTLTYTNRYSAWAEAPTAQAVNGQCTDPATLVLQSRRGCYANYVRVYLPKGSTVLSVAGVEESLGATIEHERLVLGGYLRINPGEQRVVRMSYRLPDLPSGTMVLEKQPGTLAQPVLVTAHTAGHQARVHIAHAADLQITYNIVDGAVAFTQQTAPDAAEAFVRHEAYMLGLKAWQANDRATATLLWSSNNVLDHVLDHAGARADAGDQTAATALLEAIAPLAEDGRAWWQHAALAEANGDKNTAQRLYSEAAQRSPHHPLAQLDWTRSMAVAGQPLPTLAHMAPDASALRRWHATAQQYAGSGALEQAASLFAALLQATPNDHAVALEYADLLLRMNNTEQAQARYDMLATEQDVWGYLAAARVAELHQDSAAALEQYRAALPLAGDLATAMRVGDGLRVLNDVPGATQAYTRAAELAPTVIWPLLATGDLLRATDAAAAQHWYERAQRLDPTSGYPDWALGLLLAEQGNLPAALPLLETAVAKQPDIVQFRDTLDQVRAHS